MNHFNKKVTLGSVLVICKQGMEHFLRLLCHVFSGNDGIELLSALIKIWKTGIIGGHKDR